MTDEYTASWIETALWIRNVPPLELILRSACIPLVPCGAILIINGLVKLIGG